MPDQADEILDATVSDPNQAAPGLFTPGSKTYDPDEFRDQARKRITYWLLTLLTALVSYAFVCFFFLADKPSFEHLKQLVELLLGPFITLVSAATGFYFGAQAGNKNNDS